MLTWLKNKISRYGSLSGTSSELTNTTLYYQHSADPNQPELYMMTMFRAPDCYVKEDLCPVAVRRQGFWNQWRLKLRVSSAHLVGFIMRRACCDASGAFRV
ncbi:MAG: hypothetical protein ACJA0F_000926, partial [Dinoroseobacter sp.]